MALVDPVSLPQNGLDPILIGIHSGHFLFFLSPTPKTTHPSLLTMVKKIAPKSSGNAITNFIRSEITAPEKRAGNTSIAISLTVFGLAVTFLRSLGDMLGV
ncbi:hypothetical protein BGW38_004050 [Lunasporangiospora selenospora]|uniref:Uncharacterized protein n=1 Tax=Lunasporangiospora selenospora TaxID=979761 RepID=A0A9P6KCA2_9FUNG|nr:hypothetical protein BGW38_004050 [Lunasporangiospora selenospora]